MENYEKKYKDALSWIKDVYPTFEGALKEDAEHFFPELKESNDKRIKEAISYAIANSIHEDGTLINGVTESGAMDWLEKQGEQKPTDKIEPKFKVGDWIVASYGNANQVIAVDEDNDGFTLDDGTYFSGSWCDMYHFWTIGDAKAGDVLVDNCGNICIYQEPSTKLMYHSYCYGNNKCFIDGEGSHAIVGTYPATKEQRDLLSQKMKEAGYMWDAEKKELKEISQEYPLTPDECIKPAWSEEDERMRNASIRACQYMVEHFENSTKDYEDAIDWLNSLKNRVQPQWKPSDEQLRILLNASNGNYMSYYYRSVLSELYRNLKKL